jgi:putative transposase
MRAACADLDAELVEFNGETDHVHPLVAYPHSRSPHSSSDTKAPAPVSAPICADTSGRSPISPTRGGASLSIIKPYIERQARPPKRRAPPNDGRDGLTPD